MRVSKQAGMLTLMGCWESYRNLKSTFCWHAEMTASPSFTAPAPPYAWCSHTTASAAPAPTTIVACAHFAMLAMPGLAWSKVVCQNNQNLAKSHQVDYRKLRREQTARAMCSAQQHCMQQDWQCGACIGLCASLSQKHCSFQSTCIMTHQM